MNIEVKSRGITLEITGLPLGPKAADLTRYTVEFDSDFGETVPSQLRDRQTGELIKGEQLREVLFAMAEMRITNEMHYLLAEIHAMFSEIRDIVQDSEGEMPPLEFEDVGWSDSRATTPIEEIKQTEPERDHQTPEFGHAYSDEDWEQVAAARTSYSDY